MNGRAQEQLAKFSQVSIALAHATSLNQLSEIVVTLGSSLLGAQAAAIWKKEIGSPLKLLTHIGKNKQTMEYVTHALNAEYVLFEQLFSSQEVLFVEDLSFWKAIPQLHTYLQNTPETCIVMRIRKNTAEYICFFFLPVKRFSLFTKEIALAFADQMLNVIEKQSVEFSEIPKYENIVKKIVGLQKITSLLSYASTKEKVGEIMVKEGFNMIDAQVGEVVIFDEKTNTYDVITQIGYPKKLVDTWPTTYRAKDTYLTNVVIQKKQPLFITNVHSIDKKFKTLNEIIHATGLSSLSFLPLKVKEKVFGSINFYFRTPQNFTDFDKQVILMLAGQCAQALDRVISREKLYQSKQDLERILLKVGEGIIIRDARGKILFMNNEAKRVYLFSDGKQETSLSGKRNLLFVTDEEGRQMDTTQLHYEKMFQDPHVYEKDLCLTWDDETTQWLRIKSFPIVYKKTLQNIVDIVQDISDLKQKELIKEEFIGIASHELKTPLTSLTLYLSALQRSLKNNQYENMPRIVTQSIEQTNRLSSLVKDMLDITKIKYSEEKIRKRQIALGKLVKETISEMKPTILTHTVHIKGTVEGKVLGDKEKIRRVLINLVNNAVKYSPDATSIDIMLSRETNNIKVCVKDYGIGINKKDLDSIFKPFVRTNPKKLRVPGMGLGLYIAAEIIKAHNGKIWGRSDQQKKQTSFCFLLPTI